MNLLYFQFWFFLELGDPVGWLKGGDEHDSKKSIKSHRQ